MKFTKMFLMLAIAVSGSTIFVQAPVFAQDEDVVILNRDGEKVGVEQVKEVRKAQEEVAPAGKRTVKIENGEVIVLDEDGVQQVFDIGEARSFMVNRSVQTVDNNGQRETKSVGKVIVVGPDGIRHEFEFDGNEIPGMKGGGKARLQVLRPGAPADPSQPAVKSYMVGIHCSPVSDLLQQHLELEPNTGLVVEQVTPGGAAEKAGVEPNDILMYADDQQLSNTSDLRAATDRAGKDGGVVAMTLIRAGKEMTLEVTPEERKAVSGIRRRIPGMIPEMVGPQLEILEEMPKFEMHFKDMGPGVFIGPGFDDPSFERMNDRIKALQERVEQLHKEMRDDR